MTEVRRIDLAATGDLEQAIKDLSENMAVGGYRLAATFVYGSQLLLVFQK